MQLQYDTKDAIPAESADSFEPFEQDGATVFMHKDLAAQKRETYRNQGQLTNLNKKLEGLESSFASQQAEAVKAAELKAAAELEDERQKLIKSNDHAALHELEMQQAKAEQDKLQQALSDQQTQYNELQHSITDAKKSELATKIATQFTTPEMADLVAESIKNRIADADGQIAMTNASGEAVANDIDSIIEMLKDDPKFKGFAKAPGSMGGYGGKGGQTNAGGGLDLNKPYSDMNSKERVAYIKRNKKAG